MRQYSIESMLVAGGLRLVALAIPYVVAGNAVDPLSLDLAKARGSHFANGGSEPGTTKYLYQPLRRFLLFLDVKYNQWFTETIIKSQIIFGSGSY